MAINFPSNPSVNDTFTVDDKTFLWTGEYWRTLSSAVTFPGVIKDADSDTRVEVEQSADEDTIRFNVAGSEKGYFDSSGLTVSDSATANFFVSSGSGANLMPSGTTAERPASPSAGMFRFNTTTGEPEWYSTSVGWVKFRNGPSFTASYVVVAGGGGGGQGSSGYANGGGGGAGGYRNSYASETSGGGGSTESSLTIASGVSYSVVIGGGGAGSSSGSNRGSNGVDSTFSGITSTGGGGGGSATNVGGIQNGASGGSGGGAAISLGGSGGSGGAGTANQGYAGGNYVSGGAGAGGGGAGGTATGGTNSTGGVGLASSIRGSSETRAAGGTGGGGNTPATDNTGNGGPGAAGSGNGGNGGSGIVILRYSSSYPDPTVSAGLASTTTTVGSDKVTVFTAGIGTVSW